MHIYLISPLLITIVLIGSFLPAPIRAFLEVSGSSQVSSNITLHLLILATYLSTSPFPFPIGISNHFFVIGTSGNILIHSLPNFLVYLTITFLADSICLFVRKALSIAFNPYSPNDTTDHLVARPEMCLTCCFLCFRLLGVSNIVAINEGINDTINNHAMLFYTLFSIRFCTVTIN